MKKEATNYSEIIKNPVIKKIAASAKKKKIEVYLVGGFLRDMLLKRKRVNFDIDFALEKDSIKFAKSLARKLKLPFVLLDEKHGSCRIVQRKTGRIFTYDFTDYRGKDIQADLKGRDFTINAFAFKLDDVYCKKPRDKIIDIFQGRKDLKSAIIKVVDKKAFDEDPLRLLRAFSFSAALDFKIAGSTLDLIKGKFKKITKAAAERIQEELFKIFHSDLSASTIEKMHSCGILLKIFPELAKMIDVSQGPYHHLDVWNHSLTTLKELEEFLKDLRGLKQKNKIMLRQYLDENIASDHKRYGLLKLAALLHDLGKPGTKKIEPEGKLTFHGHERKGLDILEKILKRFRLSNHEVGSLKRMMLHHLRPGYLSDHEYPTARAVFRYFRDTQEDALAILLLSLADARATRGPLKSKYDLSHHEKIIFSLIDEYFTEKTRVKPKKIIDGRDVIKSLDLKPGPMIGELLLKVQEAQAEGKIKTKAQAIQFLKKAV